MVPEKNSLEFLGGKFWVTKISFSKSKKRERKRLKTKKVDGNISN